MTCTLVVIDEIADRLRLLANDAVETGGVLLARAVDTSDGGLRLLARELIEVSENAYDRRSAHELLIRSEGYVPALAVAEAAGCVPIWFHTHPGVNSRPEPSEHDIVVNASLSDLFRLRADSPYFGALIVGPTDDALTFTGLLDDGQRRTKIDRLWLVGSSFELVSAFDADAAALPSMFDRNVRAFGGPVQAVLGDLKVAIIGCGGTGSAVAEQLIRLGVRDLTLIDPDDLSESNVTRVYGSTVADVGRPKVEVLADHLRNIIGTGNIAPIKSSITDQPTARVLCDVDVIYGCTDDNAGRMVLSRAATFLATPVIDCGVLLSSDANDRLDGIHGRVTVLYPGEGCLICRGRIDLSRARSEMLAPDEHKRLVDEGYASALPGVEPAVVAYTTATAALAVAELIERLTGYGVQPAPGEVLLRLHDREMSTNNQAPNELHYCDPSANKIGLGLTNPFLEQTW
jgi:proteasome lid subunit RPN8/RPN11